MNNVNVYLSKQKGRKVVTLYLFNQLSGTFHSVEFIVVFLPPFTKLSFVLFLLICQTLLFTPGRLFFPLAHHLLASRLHYSGREGRRKENGKGEGRERREGRKEREKDEIKSRKKKWRDRGKGMEKREREGKDGEKREYREESERKPRREV